MAPRPLGQTGRPQQRGLLSSAHHLNASTLCRRVDRASNPDERADVCRTQQSQSSLAVSNRHIHAPFALDGTNKTTQLHVTRPVDVDGVLNEKITRLSASFWRASCLPMSTGRLDSSTVNLRGDVFPPISVTRPGGHFDQAQVVNPTSWSVTKPTNDLRPNGIWKNRGRRMKKVP